MKKKEIENQKEIIEEYIKKNLLKAESDPECLILINDKYQELTEEEAQYFYNSVLDSLDWMLDNLFDFSKVYELNDISNVLLRAFTYSFDKSIEIVYFLRIKNHKKTCLFSLEELYDGISGDKIPSYIQLKVKPIIGLIALFHQKQIEELKGNMKFFIENDISFKDALKTHLLVGCFLGAEFCLRINLDDASEMDRYLM